MADNFSQPGEVITLTAPSPGTTAGFPIKIGSLVVVPLVTVAEAAQFSGAVTGVFEVPKATGTGWTEGLKVYWDVADGEFNTSSSGNTLVGVAVAVAGSADATGLVRFDGVAR
jgi:predicted RecA/RadA family phage recombinase